jgi:hypothetical protein
MIGNPYQITVISFNEMFDKYLEWNGVSACFNSHNGFEDIRTVMGKQMPQKIWYTSVHFDFDNPKKIENAHLDCIKLSRFLDQENIPRLSVFTGGKGFQVFILLKPHLYMYDNVKNKDGYSNQDSVKGLTKSIQTYLKNHLDLRTIDSQCMGTPKKQSRALYSYHRFTRSDDVTNCVAIPLTDEMLYEWNVTDIIEYSHHPEFKIPVVNGERYMTLVEMFENFKISLKKQKSEVEFADYRRINKKITDTEAKLFLDVISESKPCIASEMMSPNPMHKIRLAFATFAKKLGKDRAWFKRVYETIGFSVPYVDIHNDEIRNYQIDWVWDNPNYRKESTCDEIKRMGKCLKYKCRRYKE